MLVKNRHTEVTGAVDVEIRAATQLDLPAILEISRSTPWEKTDYLASQVSRGCIDVACEGDCVVGFIVWNREFFSKPFIWLTVVAPALRRKGIGTLLFSSVEKRCRGVRLYSSTNRSNDTMRQFFERRGYRLAGEIDLDPGDPEVFYCINA